jgi:hypothetical protein
MICTSRIIMLRSLKLAVCLMVLGATGCIPLGDTPVPTPLHSIPAKDLLLDVQAFPRNWSMDPCTTNCNSREGEAKALRVFGVVGVPGHVIQEVFRLKDVASASDMFQSARVVDFRKSTTRTPSSDFLPPPEITYRSSIADEYYLGCGIDIGAACKAIMRYDNYFISFYFDLDTGTGEGLKVTEIEPVLRDLDAHVAARFGVPRQTATPVPSR